MNNFIKFVAIATCIFQTSLTLAQIPLTPIAPVNTVTPIPTLQIPSIFRIGECLNTSSTTPEECPAFLATCKNLNLLADSAYKVELVKACDALASFSKENDSTLNEIEASYKQFLECSSAYRNQADKLTELRSDLFALKKDLHKALQRLRRSLFGKKVHRTGGPLYYVK